MEDKLTQIRLAAEARKAAESQDLATREATKAQEAMRQRESLQTEYSAVHSTLSEKLTLFAESFDSAQDLLKSDVLNDDEKAEVRKIVNEEEMTLQELQQKIIDLQAQFESLGDTPAELKEYAKKEQESSARAAAEKERKRLAREVAEKKEHMLARIDQVDREIDEQVGQMADFYLRSGGRADMWGYMYSWAEDSVNETFRGEMDSISSTRSRLDNIKKTIEEKLRNLGILQRGKKAKYRSLLDRIDQMMAAMEDRLAVLSKAHEDAKRQWETFTSATRGLIKERQYLESDPTISAEIPWDSEKRTAVKYKSMLLRDGRTVEIPKALTKGLKDRTPDRVVVIGKSKDLPYINWKSQYDALVKESSDI